MTPWHKGHNDDLNKGVANGQRIRSVVVNTRYPNASLVEIEFNALSVSWYDMTLVVVVVGGVVVVVVVAVVAAAVVAVVVVVGCSQVTISN